MAVPNGVTQATFDEAYYLAQNPDIAAYLAANPVNAFMSGWGHFISGGYEEGRKWRVLGATVTQTAVQANPTIAAFVRSLYNAYFGREPDVSGWEFWTNEIVTGRNTRDGVRQAFANDKEASDYSAGHQSPPYVAPGVTPAPTGTAITPASFLNSKIFGVDVKLLLIGGVAAYFLLGEK